MLLCSNAQPHLEEQKCWSACYLQGHMRTLQYLAVHSDDCALVSQTLNELQQIVEFFSNACKDFGLTISTKKIELLFQPPPNYSGILHPIIEINYVKINTTEKITYLGSTVTNKALLNEEITSRISKASSRFGRLRDKLWNKHKISLATKIMVYKAVVIPTLLYGSEAWTPYKVLIKKLDSFHNLC